LVVGLVVGLTLSTAGRWRRRPRWPNRPPARLTFPSCHPSDVRRRC